MADDLLSKMQRWWAESGRPRLIIFIILFLFFSAMAYFQAQQ